MAARFTTLASGSTGNASLLDLDGHGILLDFGLGPRRLTQALERCGTSLDNVRDVFLTHLHGDHWRERTLALLSEAGATLWCHAEHARDLRQDSTAFNELEAQERVRLFELDQPLECGPCRVLPFFLDHDIFTCGFRLEGTEVPWAIAFASDLGCWDDTLADRLAEVDVLAVEFNHDVVMQMTSHRQRWLIRRNLGNEGHLSNDQAARLLEAVLKRSVPGRLRHLIGLHLSRQCNRPELAVAAAEAVRRRHAADFHIRAAPAYHPLPWIALGEPAVPRRPTPALRPRRRVRVADFAQPFFPGWDSI